MKRAIDDNKLKSSPIFVVDDEIVNLKLIERILESDGYSDITCVQTATEAITACEEKQPALILLDINMPGMDGFDVVDCLTRMDKSVPPIVFVTAQDSHELRVRAFEKGVLDFISKPFDRLELLSRVKNLIALENAYLQLETRNQSLEEIVNDRTQELRQTQLEVVQKLGRAAEYRDNETGAHIIRMSNSSAVIANTLGFDQEFCNRILHASPMHDIGKIGIPDNILLKPMKLTPEEWKVMQTHTILGAEILNGSNSDLMQQASEIALHHHEKWDGSGYPHNLCEEEIPIACRIVALSDVFDALVSDRPYKKAWTVEDACDYINDQSGQHFDPAVVNAFHKCFDEIMEIRDQYQDSPDELAAKQMFRTLTEQPRIGTSA